MLIQLISHLRVLCFMCDVMSVYSNGLQPHKLRFKVKWMQQREGVSTSYTLLSMQISQQAGNMNSKHTHIHTHTYDHTHIQNTHIHQQNIPSAKNTCTHTCMHTHTYKQTLMPSCTHTHAYTKSQTHTRMHTHTHAHAGIGGERTWDHHDLTRCLLKFQVIFDASRHSKLLLQEQEDYQSYLIHYCIKLYILLSTSLKNYSIWAQSKW